MYFRIFLQFQNQFFFYIYEKDNEHEVSRKRNSSGLNMAI